MVAIALVLALAVVGPCFAQVSENGPTRQSLLERVASVEKQLADLKVQAGLAQEGEFSIRDPKSKAAILLRSVDGNSVVQMLDGAGKLLIEIGFSEWWGGPLLTIQQDDKKSYFWAGASTPSRYQWADVKVMAENNCHSYLTDKLLKESLTVATSSDSTLKSDVVNVFVDTTAQTTWNYYAGAGKFSLSDRELRAAYAEAGKYVYEQYIKDAYDLLFLKPYEVRIYFTIRGYKVGTWLNGTITLAGE